MDKPFSLACERNKEPILTVLKKFITSENRRLFEVGSGTGQHATYFAAQFSQLKWVTSDVSGNHWGIKKWIDESKLKNIEYPIRFEVGKDEFPKQKFDLVFTANTFHIMSWKNCKTLMKMWGHRLREGAQVMIYGPFNYNGQFTSESNAEFDKMLKEKNPESGIRSFEDVNRAMIKNGFALAEDFEMPANNRMLVYTRLEFVK